MKQSRLVQELQSVGFTVEPKKGPGPVQKQRISTVLTKDGSIHPPRPDGKSSEELAAALLESPPVTRAQAYMVEIAGVEVPVLADTLRELTTLDTNVAVGQSGSFAPQSAADLLELAQSEDEKYLNEDLHVVNGATEGLRVLVAEDFVPLDQPSSVLTHCNLQSKTNRVLVFVHGGHSNSRHVLEAFDQQFLTQWADHYRTILFFTHKTLTVGPLANAAQLTEGLANLLPVLDGQFGTRTEVDIICHSRGGLVVRSLLELPTEASEEIIARVRKVCFVASPNGGMNLFNPTKYSRAAGLFGLISTLLENMPGGLVKKLAEWLAVEAKYLITLAANNLENEAETIVPGIACLAPDSDLIKRLGSEGHKPGDVLYYAVGSNYEKLLGVVDELVDAWVDAPNDLVVETQSPAGYIEYGSKAHAGSPLQVERLLVFGRDEAAVPWQKRYPGKVDHDPDPRVHHSAYITLWAPLRAGLGTALTGFAL